MYKTAFVNSAKEDMFSPVSIPVLVCPQDYAKKFSSHFHETL